MLLPALAKAKSEAQGMQCLSQMRQWGVAQKLYATDFNDAMPRDGTDAGGEYAPDNGGSEVYAPLSTPEGNPKDPFAWFNQLPQLVADHTLATYFANEATGAPQAVLPFPGNNLGKIWQCPAIQTTSSDKFLDGGEYGFFSYCMNLDLKLTSNIQNGVDGNDFAYPTMPRFSAIRFPAATVLLTEVAFSPTLENYTSTPSRNGIYPAARWDQFPQRHNLRGSLVFTDGHSQLYKRSYVFNANPTPVAREEIYHSDIYWDPNRDINP